MLEIKDLSGGWQSTTVIEDLSFRLQPQETVSIIGRNGVGKTTLLELIMGRAQRSSGNIRIGGLDIGASSTFQRSQAGIAYVPQSREVFPSLTVAENLLVARRPGPWAEQRIFDLFPSLAARRGSFGRHLSGGEQQMLSIARALIGNPRVLLLDEPTEGLAPLVVEHLIGAIHTVVGDSELAVLLVEQNVTVALDLSTRCLVMDRGRFVFEESSAVLRKDLGRVSDLMGLDGD